MNENEWDGRKLSYRHARKQKGGENEWEHMILMRKNEGEKREEKKKKKKSKQRRERKKEKTREAKERILEDKRGGSCTHARGFLR